MKIAAAAFWRTMWCVFNGHRWNETGDVNIRFRQCERCEAKEMSMMLQPWKPV